jgi:hypothetical protein
MSDWPLQKNHFWRPRFSLLTALLLMTIVGMAISLVRLWREVGPLRADVLRLRNEVGALMIDDETKPCAIRVRTSDDLTWKWRVWIPQGREYLLRCAGESIPKQGFPAGNSSISLSTAGEIWIEYHIAFDPRSQTWQDKLTTRTGSVGSSQQVWASWSNRTSTSDGVEYETKCSEPGKTIILARVRVSQAQNSQDIEDPSAGFMIWLEPLK